VSEKRHPPSQRRRDEARRRGEVAVSPSLVGAGALLAATVALILTAGRASSALLALARHGFAGDGEPGALVDEAWRALAVALGPPLAAALAAALAIGMAQTRGLVTAAPLAPSGPRRRPVDGAPRALAFALVAAAASVIAARIEAPLVAQAAARPGAWLLGAAAAAIGRIALRVAVVMVAAGAVDYVLRRARLERSLWMTRAEAEQERREEEGDPRLAAERRRRHLALAGSRVADQVAASLVVVAADGAAAGLRADGARLVVTVAGERLVAARIVDLARRLHVAVRADVELAAAVATLAPGDAVPATLAERAWRIARLRENK